jgi:hypothetical protein
MTTSRVRSRHAEVKNTGPSGNDFFLLGNSAKFAPQLNAADSMTTETRRITFSSEELVQALSRHRRDEKQPLPESRIRGSKVENGEGPIPRVTLMLDPAGGDGAISMDFRPTEVAVALIKFCRLKRIPLPKRANKSLGVDNGKIALVLQLGDH